MACGQRVRNTQPDGGATGLGMSPFSGTATLSISGSGFGLAASSACVYGCSGRANSSAVGAISITWPR